jgi:hypothetical protein
MTGAAASVSAPVRRRFARAILAAGLAGGAIDAVYACVVGLTLGRSVMSVWQGVAGGWLGRDAAVAGGIATALLGLATHFGIAICMAAAFALVAGRVRALYRQPLLAGAAYGLVLYGIMYRIVLPLRWPAVFPRWDGVRSLTDIATHIGVGIAIALVLARAARQPLDR